MTVESFAKFANCEIVCMPHPEREITGAYIGDLLSWVMGRAEQGDVWITIMSNINTVAVATLTDASCILLAEGVMLDENALEAAKSKEVNILSTKMTAFEAAIRTKEALN